MKQYQVYIRGGKTPGWHYADTYTDPALAMAAQVEAVSKGFSARTIIAQPVQAPADVAHG